MACTCPCRRWARSCSSSVAGGNAPAWERPGTASMYQAAAAETAIASMAMTSTIKIIRFTASPARKPLTSVGRGSAVFLSVALPAAQLAERDQPLPAFIPEHETRAAKALAQSDSADCAELRMIAQHLRQPVVWNSAAQMMDVVHADIGCKPAQQHGQVVVRAAVKSRLLERPGRTSGPISVFELMLDVKQPNADRGCQQRYRQLHEQKRAHADQPHHRRDNKCDRRIGRHDTEPGSPVAAQPVERKAVPQHEEIGWGQSEHDGRMAVQPIAQPLPP